LIKLSVRCLGLALLLVLAAGAVRAEVVKDLYSAEVEVKDQSAAELTRASRAALSEVLVKVSGSVDVLANPAIAEALKGARNHLQRYSYSGRAQAGEELMLQAVFDSGYVTRLVIDAGAPIWTANRPLVLVWLTEEDAAGRQFVNNDTAPAQVAYLRQAFARRGVPVQFPLYDLADTAALSLDQAWSLDALALTGASARYQLEDVLAGRYALLSTGGVVGEWTFFRGEERLTRSVTSADEAEFMQAGVALAAEAMAARYAVAASVNTDGLTMTVSGVTSYADYAAVVAWLEHLELVDSADVVLVRGDTITVALQAQADAAQLATIMELNKRLVPLSPGVPGGGPAQLNYQWVK
jgi:hypothetical protein